MTEPIRLLHFADVHIGMENYGRTDPATGLSSRVVDFLRRMDEMVAYARDHEVDLAIFAGDAFKSRNPNPTFQREFAWRIQDLAALCPVVLLVGNHDLPNIDKRASSIEIYETLRVPNTILGRDYRLLTVETKRGPVLVGTAPYPVRNHLLRDVDLPHNRTIAQIDGVLGEHLDRRLQEPSRSPPYRAVLETIAPHDLLDAIVRVTIIADPETDLRQDRLIHTARC